MTYNGTVQNLQIAKGGIIVNLFYYGIWCAGVLGAVSLLMVYISYKKTIKDVSRLPYPKGKWMQQFCQDYHQLLKEHSQINNPVIFIKKRMNGRKIGPISLHRLKGTMWYAFVFSILFAGLDLVQAYRSGQWTPANPWSRPGTLIAAGGMIAALIIFRQLLAFSYQEELIEDGLLDYLENEHIETNKVVPMETSKAASQTQAGKTGRNLPVTGKASKLKKGKVISQPADKPAAGEAKELPSQEVMEQLARGIQESAATNNKYGHLLSKEEEKIVRDVIKEFLT